MWRGIDQQLYGIDRGNQRLTDTVEKDLANAALILVSDIPDGSIQIYLRRSTTDPGKADSASAVRRASFR
jgi:hypothetical protein